jgi:hypothetical protein
MNAGSAEMVFKGQQFLARLLGMSGGVIDSCGVGFVTAFKRAMLVAIQQTPATARI